MEMENEKNRQIHPKDIKDKDKDLAFRKDQANDNLGDPSAKRNIGLGGAMQRAGQKDKLHNLSIGGNEVTGYGANTEDEGEELRSGPGFGAEGSEYKGDPIRKTETKPNKPTQQG